MTTASVLGVFAHVGHHAAGHSSTCGPGASDLTVYTPVPVEEVEDEVEKVRPRPDEVVDRAEMSRCLGQMSDLLRER